MEKNKYRVLLVDIDGTLTCAAQKTPNQQTARALETLRQRGVTVVLATGRTLFACRSEVMGGFVPDYYICINGTYVTAGDGRVLYHHPMSVAQMETVLSLADREACPMGFAFPESYYMYKGDEVYRPFYAEVNGDMLSLRDGSDRTRHLEGLPYAAFGIIPPDKLPFFRAPELGLHITAYDTDVYDVCQEGHTKATGAARLLEALGLGWEELVAVGDGENDIELLEAAGLGIAMGNAPDYVKIHADAVTGAVLEDGVLQVIRAYF